MEEKICLGSIKWDDKGLVPVIVQEKSTKDVLMFAWMNHEALQKTVELKRSVFFSRSREKLWFKGEESGNVFNVEEIRMDCDNDVLLLLVSSPSDMVQTHQSVACHTGRHSCFYSLLQGDEWVVVDPVIQDPETLYSK